MYLLPLQKTIDYLELRALTKKYYPNGIPGAKGGTFQTLDEKAAAASAVNTDTNDAAEKKLEEDFIASKGL